LFEQLRIEAADGSVP